MNRWLENILENALNRYLTFDPESKRRMALLQGKKVTLELLGVNITIQFIFTSEKITLRWSDFLPADLVIKGTPINLFSMHMTDRVKQRFFIEEDVIVEGDMELAQEVLAFLDALEIDWEDKLSHWIGGVPAYHLMQFLRNMKNRSSKFCKTMSRNMNEYVHEEINLFPSPEALRDFFHDVDELRMDIDRLEARVDKIT